MREQERQAQFFMSCILCRLHAVVCFGLLVQIYTFFPTWEVLTFRGVAKVRRRPCHVAPSHGRDGNRSSTPVLYHFNIERALNGR